MGVQHLEPKECSNMDLEVAYTLMSMNSNPGHGGTSGEMDVQMETSPSVPEGSRAGKQTQVNTDSPWRCAVGIEDEQGAYTREEPESREVLVVREKSFSTDEDSDSHASIASEKTSTPSPVGVTKLRTPLPSQRVTRSSAAMKADPIPSSSPSSPTSSRKSTAPPKQDKPLSPPTGPNKRRATGHKPPPKSDVSVRQMILSVLRRAYRRGLPGLYVHEIYEQVPRAFPTRWTTLVNGFKTREDGVGHQRNHIRCYLSRERQKRRVHLDKTSANASSTRWGPKAAGTGHRASTGFRWSIVMEEARKQVIPEPEVDDGDDGYH